MLISDCQQALNSSKAQAHWLVESFFKTFIYAHFLLYNVHRLGYFKYINKNVKKFLSVLVTDLSSLTFYWFSVISTSRNSNAW